MILDVIVTVGILLLHVLVAAIFLFGGLRLVKKGKMRGFFGIFAGIVLMHAVFMVSYGKFVAGMNYINMLIY